MADRTVVIPEPDINTTGGLSIVITRAGAGAPFEITVGYVTALGPLGTSVALSDLTAPQRTALRDALIPVLNRAKTQLGF
jgi:hypothetical protein